MNIPYYTPHKFKKRYALDWFLGFPSFKFGDIFALLSVLGPLDARRGYPPNTGFYQG